jgi:hypothetical protein
MVSVQPTPVAAAGRTAPGARHGAGRNDRGIHDPAAGRSRLIGSFPQAGDARRSEKNRHDRKPRQGQGCITPPRLITTGNLNSGDCHGKRLLEGCRRRIRVLGRPRRCRFGGA